MAYMRLSLHGVLQLWPAFKAGYEEGGGTVARTPATDTYLLTHCLLARANGLATDELIDALLAGTELY